MQKYYGIWHKPSKTWVFDAAGCVICLPLRFAAEVQRKQIEHVQKEEGGNFEVREFPLDSGLVIAN